MEGGALLAEPPGTGPGNLHPRVDG
jgi:hypothetical protein